MLACKRKVPFKINLLVYLRSSFFLVNRAMKLPAERHRFCLRRQSVVHHMRVLKGCLTGRLLAILRHQLSRDLLPFLPDLHFVRVSINDHLDFLYINLLVLTFHVLGSVLFGFFLCFARFAVADSGFLLFRRVKALVGLDLRERHIFSLHSWAFGHGGFRLNLWGRSVLLDWARSFLLRLKLLSLIHL